LIRKDMQVNMLKLYVLYGTRNMSRRNKEAEFSKSRYEQLKF